MIRANFPLQPGSSPRSRDIRLVEPASIGLQVNCCKAIDDRTAARMKRPYAALAYSLHAETVSRTRPLVSTPSVKTRTAAMQNAAAPRLNAAPCPAFATTIGRRMGPMIAPTRPNADAKPAPVARARVGYCIGVERAPHAEHEKLHDEPGDEQPRDAGRAAIEVRCCGVQQKHRRGNGLTPDPFEQHARQIEAGNTAERNERNEPDGTDDGKAM